MAFNSYKMKKDGIIIFLLLVSFSISIYSQTTFQKVYRNPEDQVINCVIEDDNGNFIMVGRKFSETLNIMQAYIIRIDSTGELLNEVVPDSTLGGSIFFNIFLFNDSLYILGAKTIDSSSMTKLWYLKLDKNLVKSSEKYLGIPANCWFSYMNSIIDIDSNFVMTGYISRWDTLSQLNNDVFFYKLSLTGDSISSSFIASDYILSLSFDIIEKNDQSGYYAYGFKYSTAISHGGQRFDLSDQFDSINVVSVPYGLDSYISSEKLNDSIIILSGNGELPEIPSYSISVLTTTIDNTPINYNHFKIEGEMRDHTAIYHGVDYHNNNIYVGGTSNFNYSDPFFSTSDSWFHLIKINPDISPIWEYWYGGDAYYVLYSILATSDGGCLMVGNRFDDELQDQERDIYVAKVNDEGLILWTQEIRPDKPLSYVYPNPGTDYCNINSSIGELQIHFHNFSGQLLSSSRLHEGNNLINTIVWPAGIYLYRIYDSKQQLIQSGKWIKTF